MADFHLLKYLINILYFCLSDLIFFYASKN